MEFRLLIWGHQVFHSYQNEKKLIAKYLSLLNVLYFHLFNDLGRYLVSETTKFQVSKINQLTRDIFLKHYWLASLKLEASDYYKLCANFHQLQLFYSAPQRHVAVLYPDVFNNNFKVPLHSSIIKVTY